jgi:hypothetical protein
MADGIRAVAQVIFSDKIDEPINILERAIRLGMEAGAAYESSGITATEPEEWMATWMLRRLEVKS